MWSYYGSKATVIDYYPPPRFNEIIEPFAGSARYALKYFDRDVTIVDKYPVIVQLWKWLQTCSKNDILSLPRLKIGDSLDDYNLDAPEAYFLMGFLCAKGALRPRKKPTAWAIIDRPNFINFSLQRIASNLHKIRHWKIVLGSYLDIPNRPATWFIDPPYQFGGNAYVCSNRDIDFTELAAWCISREGQYIVCENTKANWLPFRPMVRMQGCQSSTTEAIFSNFPTAYDYKQKTLF